MTGQAAEAHQSDDDADTEWASDRERDTYVDMVVEAWLSGRTDIADQLGQTYGSHPVTTEDVYDLAERDAADGPALALFPDLLCGLDPAGP